MPETCRIIYNNKLLHQVGTSRQRKTKFITEISFTAVFSVFTDRFEWYEARSRNLAIAKTDVNETHQTNRSQRVGEHARTIQKRSRADHSTGRGKMYWTSAYCIANHRLGDSPVTALSTSSYLGPYKDVASKEEVTPSHTG